MENNSDGSDLKCIEREVIMFRKIADKCGKSERELNDMIDHILTQQIHNNSGDRVIANDVLKCLVCVLRIVSLTVRAVTLAVLLAAVLAVLASLHSPTQKLILRNSQQLIYPFMRQLRLWTLPVMWLYGHELSEWHVEQCLVANPFYTGSRLECWPCEDVRHLVDLTKYHNYSIEYCNNEKPFIVTDVINRTISWTALRRFYAANSEAIDFGTAKIECNYLSHKSRKLNDLIEKLNDSFTKDDIHIEWKINRVEAARVIRKLFIRPYFVPKTSEVALQRFIFIDGPHSAQYTLPVTEFANVWLTQAYGCRHIILEPSFMCRNNCSTVSIVLKPKDILYYNWQFWRPRSLPAKISYSKDISITFMASFY